MNPLYEQMNGNQTTLNAFANFMNQMKGKNPDAIIQQLMSSGRINQAQLNQAQQMAQQMRGVFEPFFKH